MDLALFSSDKIWGIKLKTGDGAQKFFVGVQKGSNRLTEGKYDSVNPPETEMISKDTAERQINYKIKLVGIEFLIKIFYLSKTLNQDEQQVIQTSNEIKYLNYIVENKLYERCDKNRLILINPHQPDRDISKKENALMPGKESPRRNNLSVFGFVVQINNK